MSHQNAVIAGEFDAMKPYVPDNDEDISEYRFEKFAATYFEAGHTQFHIRKPIHEPLLDLKNENDRQVGV